MISLPNNEVPTSRGLSFLWLEITEKCNLECLHCYADSSPREALLGRVDTQMWLDILRESARLGCSQVQFIGGEPTLHPDLSKLIRFASELGYSFIEVFTNATVCDETLIDTFVENGVAIATSFYSDDPKTHDQITKHHGSFARTVSNLKKFVSAGLKVRAGIIELPDNAGHAERAKHFLEKLGISDINIDIKRGVGRGATDLHSLDPFSELCGQCWKGKLCVTSRGRVYPCVFSRFVDLGDVKTGISTILQEEPLFKFRNTLSQRQNERLQDLNQPLNTAALEYVCSPNLCDPTGSGKCMPMLEPCSPETRPCSPETRCVPSMDCNPDRR